MIHVAKFSHHNAMGYLRYDGKLVATHTPRGWVALASGDEELDQLVNRAITGSANKCPAEDLRHYIGELVRAANCPEGIHGGES